MTCQVAGEVPRGDGPDQFNPDRHIEPKEQKKMDTFIHYAMAAADEAIADSGYKPSTDEAKERAGILIGSGIGGLNEIYETSVVLFEKGPRRVSPFFIPRSLINLASGQVSIKHDWRGPNHAVVTACATGAHAIGDAARLIMWGDADVWLLAVLKQRYAALVLPVSAPSVRFQRVSMTRQPKLHALMTKTRDGFVMG